MTPFFGVLDIGLLSRSDPELHSNEALTGVRRMPFSSLLVGLCVFAAGDLQGRRLRAIPSSPRLAPEKTRIFDKGGVLECSCVRGVLGVVLTCLVGNFVGLLVGL